MLNHLEYLWYHLVYLLYELFLKLFISRMQVLMCSHEQPCFIFPVAHDDGFRRIPELSNHMESVYRLERFTGISVNQYTIWEALVISTVSGIGIINKIIYQHIETETRRLIFCRRHFQTPFPSWELLYLYPNLTKKICPGLQFTIK